MSSKFAVQRLMREQQKMHQAPNKQFVVQPSPDNLFEWHFVLFNFENSPYQGGQFHGKLLIPADYPMKPPTLIFVTPQGKFKPGEKICLSFTSFHPESWSTSWTVETMLVALISFMHTNELTAGGITTSVEEKHRLAALSIQHNLRNVQFERLFRPHYDRLGLVKGGQIIQFEMNESTSKDAMEPIMVVEPKQSNYWNMIALFTISLALYYIYTLNRVKN